MSEERVEHALRHLGEDLRFSNPAQAALRRARRMRLRRNVFGGAGAALAVAAMTVPFAYSAGERPEPAALPPALASTPSPATSPGGLSGGGSLRTTPRSTRPAPPGSVALPGGLYVASASNDAGSQVYDRKLHKYRSSGYPRAWVSPDGKLAVVADRNSRLGLLDLAGHAVRWITGSRLEIGSPEWSSDSRQLVFAGPGPGRETLSIVLADVATAKARTLQPSVPCWELCRPSWLPGDKEVGLPDANQPRAALQAYSVEDGRSRRVTLPGTVQTSDAWSPDGRYVVAAISSDKGSKIGIIEAATGNVAELLDINAEEDQVEARDVVWATTDRIVVAVARELIVFSTEGKELQRIPLPSKLRGVENELAFARP